MSRTGLKKLVPALWKPTLRLLYKPTTRSMNAYTSSGRWTSAFTYVARPPAGWLSRAASTREATPVPGGEGEKDAATAVTIGQEGHAALFQTETDCVALKQSEP
jgi:hypothetical protein